MKTLTPKEELIIINDMILDFQRKKIRATNLEDKKQYAEILKHICDMKEIRRTQIEILEAYDKTKATV